MNKKDKLYFDMLRIRMIEERIAKEYPKQEMRCPVHLSIGQEAAAVGVCAALTKEDKMVSTHRGHAHYLAKGGSIDGLIGELYGKSTGCARGNGGSMHLIDLNAGFYGSTSIVGGTIPVGVGLAFADRLKGVNKTTVICIGDAAIEEGVFHESANFASIHKLNVIFAVENNLYSCFTHLRDRQPNRSFEEVACAHDLNYILCRPNDVDHIFYQTEWAIKDRVKSAPVFLEIPTYRYVQHCGPDNDDHLKYRDADEIKAWREKDPLKKVKNHDWLNKINDEIEFAFHHAKTSPFPDVAEIGKYVYANS